MKGWLPRLVALLLLALAALPLVAAAADAVGRPSCHAAPAAPSPDAPCQWVTPFSCCDNAAQGAGFASLDLPLAVAWAGTLDQSAALAGAPAPRPEGRAPDPSVTLLRSIVLRA
jgi:hypothetical protein